nr:dual specificity testis-specific protein kinase 2-like protein [Scolopendra mutilans]
MSAGSQTLIYNSLAKPCSSSLDEPKPRMTPCHGDMFTSSDVNPPTAGGSLPLPPERFCRAVGPSCQALRHAVSALNRLDDFNCEKIGSGFFSEVFKVTHRTTGQVMVLKMNMSHSNRPNMLREVQLMNKLSHPNILRFMGVCVHEGQLHALTEFINGGSLEQLLLNKSKKLNWASRIKLALDIAKGMSYLHSRGIFHRDLTSKNVLIKQEEDKMIAVVGDFGLAEKIPDPLSKIRLPTVGSAYWMSPECLKGEWYNEKADVFSYGIILCEIIARIEADPDFLPRTENFGLDYIVFSEMCPDCPPEFLKLAFTCCMIDPKQRPSFSDIVVQLEVILDNVLQSEAHNEPISVNIISEDEVTLRNTNATNYKMLHRRSKSEDTLLFPSNGFTPSDKARCHVHRPKSSAESDNILLTPKHIGEVMSLGDPYYRPSTRNHNPFAALAQFRDGKKILATSRELFSSCFELPSPSSAATPPCTPVIHAEDETSLMPMARNSRRQLSRSNSLPSSPTLLRQTLERMKSCKEDVCVESFRSLSPTPVQTRLPSERVELAFSVETRNDEYDESSRALLGQTFPVLFRRGSCESGFFSVGDGDRMSASDLSPELMFDENSTTLNQNTCFACPSPRSSVISSENDGDDDLVDSSTSVQSDSLLTYSSIQTNSHRRTMSESNRRGLMGSSFPNVRSRKSSRQEGAMLLRTLSPTPAISHNEQLVQTLHISSSQASTQGGTSTEQFSDQKHKDLNSDSKP